MTLSLIDSQEDHLSGTVGGQERAAEQKKGPTFTILHTNDMHSNLIGVGPASEYSPMTSTTIVPSAASSALLR